MSLAIYALAAGAALLGGALLSAIAVMSVASIVLRSFGLQPVQGDFELVQVGLAVCVTLLLPWCQLQGGNIIMGFFMDELSTVILTVPVIFPAIMALDLWGLAFTDKAIWFGILMLMVVEIGLIHPPVGLNVYVINSLARDVPMMETFKGVIPFFDFRLSARDSAVLVPCHQPDAGAPDVVGRLLPARPVSFCL